jgi:hypothetical protein
MSIGTIRWLDIKPSLDYIPTTLFIEGRLPEDVPKAEQPLLRADIG